MYWCFIRVEKKSSLKRHIIHYMYIMRNQADGDAVDTIIVINF